MSAAAGVMVLVGRVLFSVFFVRSGIGHVRKHESPRVRCSPLALAFEPGEETAWEQRTATPMRSAGGRSRK